MQNLVLCSSSKNEARNAVEREQGKGKERQTWYLKQQPGLAASQQPAELIANAANPSYQLMTIKTAGET